MAAAIVDIADPGAELPAEAARAFEVYRAGGGRNLSATADLLGIPRGTVKSWSSRYRWPQRLAAIDAEDDSESLKAALAMAAGLRLKALAALDAVLSSDAASDRAKVEAARLILDRTGLAPGAQAVERAEPQADLDEAELRALLTTDEGRAQLVALSRAR